MLLALGFFLLNLLIFAWAARGIFVLKPGFFWHLQIVRITGIGTGIVQAIAIFISIPQGVFWTWTGGLLLILSFFVFQLAVRANRPRRLSFIYSNDLPEFINTRGIYAWVRHPFYLAYLLTYASAPILSGFYWLWVAVFIQWVIYFHAARYEEMKFEQSKFKRQYRDYRKNTGMFFPNPLKKLIRA